MPKRALSQSPKELVDGPPAKTRRLDPESGAELPFPNTKVTFLRPPPPFQKPMPISSFSYDKSRALRFDNSSMRYYAAPPIGAQLSYGYNRWVRRPEEKGRLDGLLTAFSRAKKDNKVNLADVGVVSWRGVMTKILTSPYEERDGWELNVMLEHGTLYLEEHTSDEKVEEKNNIEPRHRTQMYYGYAFESYGTSDTPYRGQTSTSAEPPCWGGDVDTNVQWCSVVRTKLGDTRLLIGGEVDCVREKYTGTTDSFVELKTSMTIRSAQDNARFEKKLLKFYFQSFLLGVPEIVVGFRTPRGEVKEVQSFKTTQLPRLVRGKAGAWDPSMCLDWGCQFISFLKESVVEEKGTVWRVKFVPGNGVRLVKLDETLVEEVVGKEDRVGFLPRWYWDELTESANVTETGGSNLYILNG
ncbi:RAI1-domain-containing protein [Cylindrobasidium torrendii FP15055 ss-10]|uniref:Decapping nuclease n=1 Tax=Cylindrobasidium torrendii FP15055 ss-10 TaxID=1314674 RepID=A0A0D7B5P8_9AGAR|nr:RAI1-domain-containing protein [Cylindrobasidium torrendii FP15055 ss-10]